MAATDAIDETRRQEFMGRFVGELGAALHATTDHLSQYLRRRGGFSG